MQTVQAILARSDKKLNYKYKYRKIPIISPAVYKPQGVRNQLLKRKIPSMYKPTPPPENKPRGLYLE